MFAAPYEINGVMYDDACIPVVYDECLYDSNGEKVTYESIGVTPPTNLAGESCVHEWSQAARDLGRTPPSSSQDPLVKTYGFPGVIYTNVIVPFAKDLVSSDDDDNQFNDEQVPGAVMTGHSGVAIWAGPNQGWNSVPAGYKRNKIQYTIKYRLKFTCENHPPFKVVHGPLPGEFTTGGNVDSSVYDDLDNNFAISQKAMHLSGGQYVLETAQGSLGPIVADFAGGYSGAVHRSYSAKWRDTNVRVVYPNGWVFPNPTHPEGFTTNPFCIENDYEQDYTCDWFFGKGLPRANDPDHAIDETDFGTCPTDFTLKQTEKSPVQVFGTACSNLQQPGNTVPGQETPSIGPPNPPTPDPIEQNNQFFFSWIFHTTTEPPPPPPPPPIIQNPVCGNGKKETGEGCDLGDSSQGNGNGACPKLCSATCQPNSCGGSTKICGNGVREGTGPGAEQCDLGIANNGICPSTCSASCITNVCSCNNNGIAEGVESCDGTDLRGLTCTDVSTAFSGGTLTCNNQCEYSTTQCTMKTPVNVCYGELSCTLRTACLFREREVLGLSSTSNALISAPLTGAPQKVCCTSPPPGGGSGSGGSCGNGIKESNEQCDGRDFGGLGCTNFVRGSTGNLVCNSGGSGTGPACTVDSSGCMMPPANPSRLWVDRNANNKVSSASLNQVVRMQTKSVGNSGGKNKFNIYKLPAGINDISKSKKINDNLIILLVGSENDKTTRSPDKKQNNVDLTLRDLTENKAVVGDKLYFDAESADPASVITGFDVLDSPGSGFSNYLTVINEGSTPPIFVDNCKLITFEGSSGNLADVQKAADLCNSALKRTANPLDALVSCTDQKILACEWDAATNTCNDKTIDVKATGEVSNECVYRSVDAKERCDPKTNLKKINIEIIRSSSSGGGGSGSGVICDKCKNQAALSVPCGRSVLYLPFFGALQFVIAVLVIVLIYYFIRKKKSVKRKK